MRSASLAFFLIFAICCIGSVTATAQKMKAEDIVSRHVESLGSAEARVAVRNRMIIGSVIVTFTSQKNQKAEGRVVMASENAKSFFGIILNANDYTGERFSFDGNDVEVGYANVGTRSVLGNFVSSNPWMIGDGVLGGVLTSSWALIPNTGSKAKLSYEGTKNINGTEAYVLSYSRKGGSDIDVTMFFDSKTFRHIRTEYKRTSSAGIGTSPDQSSGFQETRYKMTESFSEFEHENGLDLPHKYRIEYSASGQRGTTEISWDYEFHKFLFNQNLDPTTFSPTKKLKL